MFNGRRIEDAPAAVNQYIAGRGIGMSGRLTGGTGSGGLFLGAYGQKSLLLKAVIGFMSAGFLRRGDSFT